VLTKARVPDPASRLPGQCRPCNAAFNRRESEVALLNPDLHGSPGPASSPAGAAADATSTAAATGGRLMAGGGGS
jgi:hypothetical protein